MWRHVWSSRWLSGKLVSIPSLLIQEVLLKFCSFAFEFLLSKCQYLKKHESSYADILRERIQKTCIRHLTWVLEATEFPKSDVASRENSNRENSNRDGSSTENANVENSNTEEPKNPEMEVPDTEDQNSSRKSTQEPNTEDPDTGDRTTDGANSDVSSTDDTNTDGSNWNAANTTFSPHYWVSGVSIENTDYLPRPSLIDTPFSFSKSSTRKPSMTSSASG